MTNTQTAMLIATKATMLKTNFLERGVDPCLSRKACKKADNGALWMMEKLLELQTRLTRIAFRGGLPAICYALLPHERAAGGLVSRGGEREVKACVHSSSARFGGPREPV